MGYVFRKNTCQCCGREYELPKGVKVKRFTMCKECDPDSYSDPLTEHKFNEEAEIWEAYKMKSGEIVWRAKKF